MFRKTLMILSLVARLLSVRLYVGFVAVDVGAFVLSCAP